MEREFLCCIAMSFKRSVYDLQTAVVTIAVDNQPSPSPTPPNDNEITPPEHKKPRMESPLLPHSYSLPRSETNSPQLNQVKSSRNVYEIKQIVCVLCGCKYSLGI